MYINKIRINLAVPILLKRSVDTKNLQKNGYLLVDLWVTSASVANPLLDDSAGQRATVLQLTQFIIDLHQLKEKSRRFELLNSL